jgi:hypothetical protein
MAACPLTVSTLDRDEVGSTEIEAVELSFSSVAV